MTGYQNIIDALGELGEDSGEVGRTLIELGCKGYREEGAARPVYRYLTQVKAIDRIDRVVKDEVWIGEPDCELPEARLSLPPAVLGFIAIFDDGGWPELELRS